MLIKAFKMSVLPDAQAEYQRRHNPIWPELEDVLRTHGVHKYSIFLDAQTNELFAYAELESESQWLAIAQTEVCQRWWHHIQDLMQTNADHSPRTTELQEVFRLGTNL